jgi:hypothetical protein
MSGLEQKYMPIKPPFYMGYYQNPDMTREHIWLEGIRPDNAWEWEEERGQYYMKTPVFPAGDKE